MESLLVYVSSSDSEESEESDKTSRIRELQNCKKRKLTKEKEQCKNIGGVKSVTRPDEKRLKPFLQSSDASGMKNNFSESNQTSAGHELQTYQVSGYNRTGLPYDFDEPHPLANFSCNEKKPPAFVSSVMQWRQTNSSISSGTGVFKPYVPKREREKLAQQTASCALTSLGRPQVELSNADQTSIEVNPEPNRETSGQKNLKQVCKPPKQLHLNLEGHSQVVNCVRWNPIRTDLLLSASMDHLVCVWDTSDIGTCSRRLTCHTAAVKDSRWSLCGSQVLSCGYDKTARLFNLETGQEIKKFPHKNYVTCVQFHPTDPALFLAGTFKSAILCWDARTGNITSTYSAFFGQVQDLAFLPGGDEFISAAEVIKRNSTDKGIMAWDFRSTAVLSNQIYQEAFTCTSLKVHPHESHFVAQSNGDYMALFSTRKPYKLNKFKRYEGHKVSGYHIGCDFSPDGSIVCSGSADGQAYFYDYHTSRVIRTLQAHSMPCMDVAFHPTLPHCVATCGWSGQVQVWN